MELHNYSFMHYHLLYIQHCHDKEAKENFVQATWVILLLVDAMLVPLVIFSIVLSIIVYHKRKSAKSMTNSNLTAHKGPLVDEL